MSAGAKHLEIRDLSKSFGTNIVLCGIDLSVTLNTVFGVVGENGAGKSTLLNIISGITQPDTGAMKFLGAPHVPSSYREAAAIGITRVFQEQALVPNVSVYENLLLGHDRRFMRLGQLVRTSDMIDFASSLMKEAGIDLDVRRRLADFSFSKRQLIEIVRACLLPVHLLGAEHPLILLDEPTASLELADEKVFFSLIEKMRAIGSLIFVSHRLSEVLSLSDEICVLKDGEVVDTVDPKASSESTLHSLMVGRHRNADYYHENAQVPATGGPLLFEAKCLGRMGTFSDIDLAVAAGEIVGIGGLLASGKSDLGKALAGIVPPDTGEVRLTDSGWCVPRVADLIALGVGYVPAERLAEGMIVQFPVSWNITLASGGDLFSGRLGLWRSRLEDVAARAAIERLSIKTGGPDEECWRLSGGNQQKVVLSRWLCRDVKLLILDNPTRGLDAGAKEEIYRLLRSLTQRGVGIVLISDELLELIGMSNRIAIMRHGRLVSVIPAPPEAKPTERMLIEQMLSGGNSMRSEVAA
ncbi:MAG: sugar ABC transporter ATP-binding protein [Candidatus Binataceae bacterium]